MCDCKLDNVCLGIFLYVFDNVSPIWIKICDYKLDNVWLGYLSVHKQPHKSNF